MRVHNRVLKGSIKIRIWETGNMFVSDLLIERKNKSVNFQVKNEQMVHFKSRVQYRVVSAGTIHNPTLDRWLCG